jgi:hypothetical protein
VLIHRVFAARKRSVLILILILLDSDARNRTTRISSDAVTHSGHTLAFPLSATVDFRPAILPQTKCLGNSKCKLCRGQWYVTKEGHGMAIIDARHLSGINCVFGDRLHGDGDTLLVHFALLFHPQTANRLQPVGRLLLNALILRSGKAILWLRNTKRATRAMMRSARSD